MSFFIIAVLFAVSATLADSQELANAYVFWFGGHLVALILALPLFLRLYRQRKGVEWTVILRSEWKGKLLWLAAAIIAMALFSWQFWHDEKFPVTGFVARLQSFGALALLAFYFIVAPVMAYYVSQWKKRTAAWAFFAFWPGPAFLLILSLLPEREKAHGPVLPEGLVKFFNPDNRWPAYLRPPSTSREYVAYVVIGIVVVALFIWFVISTRPVPLE